MQNRAKLQYFNVLPSILLIEMVKNLQYFIVLLSLAAMFAAFKHDSKISAGGIKIIVIDPGHGGKDPGCNGAIHKEKDVALAVALKLGKYIKENFKDVKVIFTRTTDVFVELEDRAQIANKAKADLFISIHCNAAGKPVIPLNLPITPDHEGSRDPSGPLRDLGMLREEVGDTDVEPVDGGGEIGRPDA